MSRPPGIVSAVAVERDPSSNEWHPVGRPCGRLRCACLQAALDSGLAELLPGAERPFALLAVRDPRWVGHEHYVVRLDEAAPSDKRS